MTGKANGQPSARITVPEICQRLQLGRDAVYALLDAQLIPAIRIRRKWIIGRSAYDEWEKSFGSKRNTQSVQ
jgi:excisionase family DNA binding protein